MTHPKFILLGIALIFLGLFSQQAFAYSAGCSDITIDTYTVRVEPGKSIIQAFLIKNNASERFFIDSANAFDSSSNFNVETNGYDREIPSQGTGTINVKVTGKNYASGLLETGFIELRGHFLNGNTCFLGEINRQTFNVIVNQQEQTSNYSTNNENSVVYSGFCRGIVFNAPEKAVINGSGSLEIEIINETDFRVTIRLSGENAFVDPSLISIPKNSFVKESIFVETTGSGKISYSIESPLCRFEEKTIVEASKPAKRLAEIVSINTKIDENANAFVLAVELENSSAEAISGNLEINVPAGWDVSGNKEIVILPFGKTTRTFTIIPIAFSGTQKAEISFFANSEKISKEIVFEQKQNPFIATAMAILGFAWGGLIGGILVVLIIIVIIFFLLAFHSRKQRRVILTSNEVKA